MNALHSLYAALVALFASLGKLSGALELQAKKLDQLAESLSDSSVEHVAELHVPHVSAKVEAGFVPGKAEPTTPVTPTPVNGTTKKRLAHK